jgi:hypothetical protein
VVTSLAAAAAAVSGGATSLPPGTLATHEVFDRLTSAALNIATLRGHVLAEPVLGDSTISPTASYECLRCGAWMCVVLSVDEPAPIDGAAGSRRCESNAAPKPEPNTRRHPSTNPQNLDPGEPQEPLRTNWNIGRW